MGSINLDALKGNPKIIFFTDFDGTISTRDTNDYMTDNHGFGEELRKKGNQETLDGIDTFRDSFKKMLDSWKPSFPETIEIVKKNIDLDPHFKEFYDWAKSAGVPVIVLSSGMVPVIRALLAKVLGPEADEVEIVANGVEDRPPKTMDQPGGFRIVYHDDSGFGHDKSLTIRPYAEKIATMPPHEQPTLMFAGDGVSDLSAARETDLLFAKAGKDLITYCEREGIPFTPFDDWSSILQTTKEVYAGKKSVKKVAEEGLQKVRSKE